MNKGPLVVVKWPDGHQTKMYRDDAIAQGLIDRPKMQPPAANKMAPPQANKAAAPVAPAAPDDFTIIPGIGVATARLITANGITTFAQLKAATSLDFLRASAVAAIEEWRG